MNRAVLQRRCGMILSVKRNELVSSSPESLVRAANVHHTGDIVVTRVDLDDPCQRPASIAKCGLVLDKDDISNLEEVVAALPGVSFLEGL